MDMKKDDNIEMIDIQLLKTHPRNKEIYGQEDIKELADKIKESNWINPLVVNRKNIIISGHRRCFACISLDIKEVPIERVEFNNEYEELERLLLENYNREKTIYQKTKESEIWEEIEKEKAKKRKIATQNNNSAKEADKLNWACQEKGQVREIIAKKIGLSRGTYCRAKAVIKEIDKLKIEGKEKDANFLIAIVNENVNGAKDLVELDKLNKISEDIKNKVISGEISVKQAIKNIRETLDDNKKQEEKPKIETKVCNKCEKEKSILEFYEGRNICTDCYNERANKNRNPKNVYGNEIKIDKDKIKGIDIEAIIANAKDTNKNISDVDYNSISMEFGCNIDMFIQNISKYINMSEIYKLDMIDKDNKNKFLKSIENIENTMNQIKNILI